MLSRHEDHGSRFNRKQKGKTMLLDIVRVQAQGEEMENASRLREEAIQGLKEILGENYLLHPSNMVHRKDEYLDQY